MSEIKVIVSLTSHTESRIKLLPYYLYHSIIKYNYDFVKIVLTLYKDDVKYITDDLQILIDNNIIELIIADENLTCHLKYFYAMKKYRSLPIITIDDDSIYPKNMILDLLKNSSKYPNTIICRSARIIDVNKRYSNAFECNYGVENVLRWNGKFDEVRYDLNPEGYAGILYPANILNVNDNMITEIKHFPCADDIYLTVLERRKHLPAILCKYNYNKLDMCTKGDNALSTDKNFIDMNTKLIKEYRKELI